MDHETFARWLADCGAAWQGRDPEAAAGLFTPEGLCSEFREWRHAEETPASG
ncbi:MAG TPA: hypothetical protein VLE70_09945 [Anaerolineae bacterium]|nr:hypothetical protein [Anaerolineae bacterium]